MFVATVHQFSDTGLHGIWHWKQKLENFLLRRCDGIICVSKSLRNDIISQLGEDHSNKVKLIYNWIDSNKSNSCREHGFEWDDFDKLQRKDICICGIGRLSYEKGFDILISAIAFVRGQGYTIKCDIFGEGPEKISLKKMIDSNGLSESVNLKGVSDQIDKILPQYYALAIPSRRESFGLVALEAYQAGIPVIASDIPGLQEVVVNGKTGVLFEEGNVRSLANALLCIINNDEHGEYLVQNAAVFLKNFLPNCTLLRKYNQFYNEVLKSKKI
jgi:glycosyltransferase involved in cell wall biosynthesis